VRVRKGVWLVPESFVEQVVPKLAAAPPSPPAASPAPAVSPRPPAAVSLEELRTRSYPSFTRIVIETTAPVVYKVESTGPREARVRLVGLAGEAQVESIDDGLVDDARLERAGADALLRVVFEGGAAELRVTTLADPPRLVLDFNRPQEVAARERQACTSLRTLMLDAGHGGHDSGAVGPAGLMEKELVLDVTKRVSRLLEEKLGVKVLLSRDGDHFVPLRDRTSYANRERADAKQPGGDPVLAAFGVLSRKSWSARPRASPAGRRWRAGGRTRRPRPRRATD